MISRINKYVTLGLKGKNTCMVSVCNVYTCSFVRVFVTNGVNINDFFNICWIYS